MDAVIGDDEMLQEYSYYLHELQKSAKYLLSEEVETALGAMDMSMFGADQTLTLNANNPLVAYIIENKESEHVPMFAEQLYDLALLSNQPLSTDAMAKFIKRSNDIMLLLTR